MIEPRLWLSAAKGVPVGSDDKIVHKGCGQRPSLWIVNQEDRWSCYCHRCHQSGVVFKAAPRVRMKTPKKTGYIPRDLVPVMHVLPSEPSRFVDTVKRHNLGPYLGLLRYSEDTGRIYFPDSSGSYLGLDVTGQAYARFYSPHKRNLCVLVGRGADTLRITSHLAQYLAHVHAGGDAMLVMNKEAQKAALAQLASIYYAYEHVALDNMDRRFMLNVKALTED